MTKIGFIGQGWIGKHYADDFENRLYDVVRYSLEEPYIQNKEQLKECQIVFVEIAEHNSVFRFRVSVFS